jgi:hypothetical protein
MKITWVDWNSACLRKEVNGLWVRRIREFNSALLGKWCWRLLVDKESLWYRVMSAWWHDIVALRREDWFSDHVRRFVGNGKHTYFWSDVWVGGVSFRERFNRLFELSVSKWVSVFDMFQLGCGENGEASK